MKDEVRYTIVHRQKNNVRGYKLIYSTAKNREAIGFYKSMYECTEEIKKRKKML